ncbi:VOC family protein [Streptomyces clavifer]|uniref:VOC family protein n=1 Tax=Streptomyces clavifer TaxID=68188 RepID=UPI00380D580C
MKPRTLSHVVLSTYQIDVMMPWYATFLDARVVIDSPVFKAISFDDEHHRVAFTKLPEDKKTDRSRPGLVHVAFTYPGIHALLRHYERMRDLGHKPIVATDHGLTVSLYYRDPDGGNVECFVDRFTSEAADEFAQTELFRKSAAGMDIDCEDLLARMEGGASEEALMALDEEKLAAVDLQETVKRHSRAMFQ